MKKLLFILLLIPSLAFSQGIVDGGFTRASTFIPFRTGTLATLLAASGGAYPIDVTISFIGMGSAKATLTNAGKTDTANISLASDNPVMIDYFPDGARVDTVSIPYTLHGQKQSVQRTTDAFNYSQLPTQLTGSVNVGSISVNTNIPMLQHLYEAIVGASLTLTASNGVAGQIVYLVFVTSGTTTRTVTFGTGFRATSLVTGTTSGKHFTAEFVWNDIDNVWDESNAPVAR